MVSYKLKRKKLIKTGYSYLITMPKIWLEHHQLDKGGYLDFEMKDDGSLVIKPSGVNNV